jgi:hypothetical protein
VGTRFSVLVMKSVDTSSSIEPFEALADFFAVLVLAVSSSVSKSRVVDKSIVSTVSVTRAWRVASGD